MFAAMERRLERGWLVRYPLLSRPWELVADRALERPVDVPPWATVIAVGGATLGGSWKTPLAVACARVLAGSGVRVALVGHAYGAHPGRARVVQTSDRLDAVGDEALVCARQLAHLPAVSVVVGPTRQQAVACALENAEYLVVDNALQLKPARASLALLSVDAAAPWGAGACPPFGNLRASVPALLRACDRVVAVGPGNIHPTLACPIRPVDRADAVVAARGARRGVEVLAWSQLRRLRVGLWTRVARPTRALDALRAERVHPVLTVFGADHAPTGPADRAFARRHADARGVEVWLCTSKCQMHVGDELGGLPVFAIELDLRLDASLERALARTSCRVTGGHLDPASASP